VTYLLGAYAALPVHLRRTAAERAFFNELAADRSVAGFEVPVYADWTTDSMRDVLRHAWRGNDIILTTMRGTMSSVAKCAGFGLASADSDGRAAALADIRVIRHHVLRLHYRAGRHVVRSIAIASAPRATEPRRASASFAKSLAEVGSWDWPGAQLAAEHYDATLRCGATAGCCATRPPPRAPEAQTSRGNSINVSEYRPGEPRPLAGEVTSHSTTSPAAKLDHERRRLEPGDARPDGEHRARQLALVRPSRRNEQSPQVRSPEGHVGHQRHGYADGLVEDPLRGVPANLTTSPQRDPHAVVSVNCQPVRTVDRDDLTIRIADDRARERVRVIQVTSVRCRIEAVRRANLLGQRFEMPIRMDSVQLPTSGAAPVDRAEVEASVPAAHRVVQHHIGGAVNGDQMLRHPGPQVDAEDRVIRNPQPTPASPRYQGSEARIKEGVPMLFRFGIERDRGISVDVQHPQQMGLGVPHRALAKNTSQVSHWRK
jgi:hypothetical protein